MPTAGHVLTFAPATRPRVLPNRRQRNNLDGWGGIRTHVTLSRKHAFQASSRSPSVEPNVIAAIGYGPRRLADIGDERRPLGAQVANWLPTGDCGNVALPPTRGHSDREAPTKREAIALCLGIVALYVAIGVAVYAAVHR